MGISEGDFKRIGQLIESKVKGIIDFKLDPIYLRLGIIDGRLERIEGAVTEDRNDILAIYELIHELQVSKMDKVKA